MDGWTIPGRFLMLVALLAVSACASLPADRGFGDVRHLVAERGGREWPAEDTAADSDTQKLVAEWLAQPLTADRVVQIALVNNPRQRAIYARLGLASAEVYNAGRLSNPRFSAAVLFSNAAAAASQVTFGLAQSFTDLLLLSARSRFAQGEFERAKEQAGSEILNLAADVETAYYRLVGAKQVAAMRGTVVKAAQTSADLAQRFFDAGNINALALALEQSSASAARLSAMQAEAEAVAARNALNRLMGLRAGDGRWQATDQLPMPLAQEDDFDTLIQLARRSRLDLAAKRREVDLLAASLGVNRRTRYLGNIEVGVETEHETDGSRITGPNLSVELPIFNSGAGKVAHAEALVDQADAELQALGLDIGNSVQLAHAKVMAATVRAGQFRSALIPQREAVVRRTQEEVSYMLRGQFELLLAQQQEYDAYQGYLEAVRDYWLARVELAREVGARLPSQDRVGAETVGPTAVSDEPPPGTTPQCGEAAGMPRCEPPPMHHMNHGGAAMQGMEGMDMKDMNGMEHDGHSMSSDQAPVKIKKPKSSLPKDKSSGHLHHHGDQP
jgi:cobalt-zinc-cadmium efflux system outer membrane protein